MADVNETIVNRESVHGDFRLNGACSQQIKDLFRIQQNWPSLSSEQRESLDLIATKIGRILTGDCNEPDHWHDVAGYAGLIEKILLGEYPAKKDPRASLPPAVTAKFPSPPRSVEDEIADKETFALAARLSPRTED